MEAADGAPAAHVTVLGGLAEFERQPIRERASARAVANGVKFCPKFQPSLPRV